MIRTSPSGPKAAEIVVIPVTAVAAAAAAGDSQIVSFAVPGAAVGDIGFIISQDLATAGMVVNGAGFSLAVNTIAFQLTATKAFAGGNVGVTLTWLHVA